MSKFLEGVESTLNNNKFWSVERLRTAFNFKSSKFPSEYQCEVNYNQLKWWTIGNKRFAPLGQRLPCIAQHKNLVWLLSRRILRPSIKYWSRHSWFCPTTAWVEVCLIWRRHMSGLRSWDGLVSHLSVCDSEYLSCLHCTCLKSVDVIMEQCISWTL